MKRALTASWALRLGLAVALVEEGIESMSLNPDTVVRTTVAVAAKEKRLRR